MTKTREQKEQAIDEMKKMMSENEGFIVFGFSGVSVNDLNDFRGKILNSGGNMRVAKRRLLNIALENENIDFNVDKFMGQIAFVPFSASLPDIASIIFDFGENYESIEVFGGYDLEEKAIVDSEFIERVGNLPSREVLLGQVVGAIGAPLTAFMHSIKQIAESK